MIRKGRVRWLPKGDIVGQIAFVRGLFGKAVGLSFSAFAKQLDTKLR